MPKLRKLKIRKGLTLIELMITVVMIVILTGVTVYIFRAILLSWSGGETRAGIDIGLDRGIEEMVRDLREATAISFINNDEIRFINSSGTSYIYYLYNPSDMYPPSFGQSSYELRKTKCVTCLGTYQKQITLSESMVSNTDQTDFPVLIYLASDNDLKDHAHADGSDIFFSDTFGIPLSYEIEGYDPSTGQLWAWVEVPTLSASNDTIILMCYGSRSSHQSPTPAWDSNFKAVWHMNDFTIAAVNDSTSNANTEMKLESNHPIEVDGKIYKAEKFDGLSDYMSTDYNTSLNLGINMTLEAWINFTIGGYVIERELFGTGPYGFAAGEGGGIYYGFFDTAWREFAGNTPLTTNTWYYVVGTYDGSNLKVYLNGDPDGSLYPPYSGIPPSFLGRTELGRRYNSTSYFQGIIDEVRLSNTCRSADWIKTSHNNQHDPASYQTVGSQNGGYIDAGEVIITGILPPTNPTSPSDLSIDGNIVTIDLSVERKGETIKSKTQVRPRNL